MAVTGLGQTRRLRSSPSPTVTQAKRNNQCRESPTSPAVADANMAEEDTNDVVSIHSSSSESPTIPSTEHPEEADEHMAVLKLAPPQQKKRVIALAIVLPLLMHLPSEMKCWMQKMMQGACCLHRKWTPRVAAPHHNHRSPQSNEDQGPKPVLGELNPRSHENHLLHHRGSRSAAFLNMGNHRPRWQTWPVRMLQIR